MKKKLLILIPIVLVSLVITLLVVISPKKYKADFSLDINVTESTNAITSKLVNNTSNDYKIEDKKKVVLSNKDKREIETLIKNYLEALTKTDLSSTKYSSDLDRYHTRTPSQSLDEHSAFLDDPNYKKFFDETISLTSIPLVFYSKEFNYKELKDIVFDYVTDDKIIVKAYLDEVSVKYGNDTYYLDAIMEFTVFFEDVSNQYKIYALNVEWVRDLEAYLKLVDSTERSINNKKTSALNNNMSYIPAGYGDFDYTKLKALSNAQVNKVYNDNKESIVVINSVSNLGLPTGNATGFFIKEGVLVTTYDSLYKMIENDSVRFYADINGKAVLIEGVVAVYPDLNVAILKLEEEVGTPVKIGDSTKLEHNDPVIIISSSIGLTSTVKTGIYLNTIEDDIKVLRTSLPLLNGDTGSPIFNTEGLVVGINNDVKPSGDSYVSGINNSIDIAILNDVIEKINKEEFNNIKTTSLNKIKDNNIKVVNKVNEKTWNKYLALPVITKYIPIDLYSAYSKDKYVIVRYKSNDEIFDNSTIINLYTKNLVKEGYKEKSKNVYEKDNITIRIKDNLGFIVVTVEGVI